MARQFRQSNIANRLAPREMLHRVRKAWGESPIYQAQLKGPAPDRLLARPDDPFTPDRDFAQAFCRGRMALGDESIDCEGEIETIWDRAAPDGPLFAFLQEFSWLRHLEAAGENRAAIARQLLKAWFDRYEKWSSDAWNPYYVSERLVQLCAHQDLILSGADALWRSRVLTSMARQTRHLARSAHRAETGFDRLMTSLGLCVAGFCLPGCNAPAERGLEMARRELRLQLRPDGGHVSRNPSRQLKLAARLQNTVSVISARGFQTPGFIRHCVVRTSAMAAFFRCGDGRLGVFNGGYEDDGRAVLSIHNAIERESIPTDFARHSGYYKLSAGRAIIIADAGDDSLGPCFKSAGSFHFSSGRSRIFLNCGNGGHRASQWGDALKKRAAHSAISFENAGRAQVAFKECHARRVEDSGGQLFEFTRALSAGQNDISTYVRRLFLAAGGADLRGEEQLQGLAGKALEKAVWRFHLHPQVRASLARDKRSVILLLPNKEGWRFKSNCKNLALEKSVYCGGGGAPVATEQIVIRANTFDLGQAHDFKVKWAVKRLDAI